MARIPDEVIEDLKSKHPGVDLARLKHSGLDIEVIARGPKEVEWKMFREMGNSKDPAQEVASNRALVNCCVLYPSGTQLAELIAKHPALVEVWSNKLAAMAGLAANVEVEKL